MALGIMRFLSERKVLRPDEVEAQGFSIFGARTDLRYLAIVVGMSCKTL